MFTRLQRFNGLTAQARRLAVSLHSDLLNVNTTLVVVLIILVLISQSGVGLVA